MNLSSEIANSENVTSAGNPIHNQNFIAAKNMNASDNKKTKPKILQNLNNTVRKATPAIAVKVLALATAMNAITQTAANELDEVVNTTTQAGTQRYNLWEVGCSPSSRLTARWR